MEGAERERKAELVHLVAICDDFLVFLTTDLVNSSVFAVAVSEVESTFGDIFDRTRRSVIGNVVLVFTVL